jgi:5,10-methylenetetrahydromethanopterin reductase
MTEIAGVTEQQLEVIRAAAAQGDQAAAAGQLSDDVVEFFALTGTPDDVLPRLHALVEAGATHLSFAIFPTPTMRDTFDLIASEILPVLRDDEDR